MRLVLLWLILWPIFTSVYAQTDNSFNIIPFPAHFIGHEGRFNVTATTRILTTPKNAGQLAAAQLLTAKLRAVGLPLPVVSAVTVPTGKIVLFRANKEKKCGPEGYLLKVAPERVVIEAETPKGYFYAVQTLMQLLPADVYSPTPVAAVTWSIPACDILDRPRYAYRGLMLDVVRHFMPVEHVKQTIDRLAMHKMNTFHWHLTDDQGWRIEIKKYPKLTRIGSQRKETLVGHYGENFPQPFDGKPYGGYYTQDQIRDVVRYAAARHVTIVPEIELPGHALAALAAYPELGCEPTKGYKVGTVWGVIKDVYCPSEQTFGFLEDVLTEVMGLFPGKYIHIGGDECPKDAWQKSAFCQELIKKLKLKDENELQSYFVQRIEKFVNGKGRAIIGWDEILEGGLAPNATVMSWRGTQGGIEAARQKHNVVMTPGQFCYLDKYQAEPSHEPLAIGGYLPIETVYGYEPTPTELTPEEQKYIMGVQGNLWTEYILTPAQADYMIWPRAAALAEVGWRPAGSRNFEDFAARLKAHLKRLDYLNVGYAKSLFAIRPVTQVGEDGRLQVRLEKQDSDSKIFFTTNGKAPTPASTEYNAPITLTKNTTIRAITNTGATFEQTFYSTRAKGKSYTYSSDVADPSDPDHKKLTDGLVAQSPRSDREWVQIRGADLTITVDLGDVKPVTKVSTNFLKRTPYNFIPPKSVQIALSKDGQSFAEALDQPVDYTLEGKWAVLPVLADFKTARARYVRVTIRNPGLSPLPLPRAGNPSIVALDEILVE